MCKVQVKNMNRYIMTKFVDCFIFNDELDLLEFRLTEHNDFTDYFVLVESMKTFSGKAKALHATENMERFKKWNEKIIIVAIRDDDINLKFRKGIDLERYSRDCGIRKIKEMLKNNIIDNSCLLSVVSDVDEIYDKIQIEHLKQTSIKPIRPVFQYHYYSLKIVRPTNPFWRPQKRLKLCRCKDLKLFTINEIENFENIDKTRMGWHLCYFGGTDKILTKLQSFSHFTDKPVIECIQNPNLIKERFVRNEDILGRSNETYILSDKIISMPRNICLLKNLKLDHLI